MGRSWMRFLKLGLGLACLSGVMVACSASPSPSDKAMKPVDIVSVTSGLPPGEAAVTAGTKGFAKFVSSERPSELSIVTFGSASCPAIPEAFRTLDNKVTEIVLGIDGDEICSADFGPTTTVITIPAGFALATNLLIDSKPARFR